MPKALKELFFGLQLYLLQGHVAEIHSLPHVGDFTGENEPTPILDAIESPMNLKNLSTKVK